MNDEDPFFDPLYDAIWKRRAKALGLTVEETKAKLIGEARTEQKAVRTERLNRRKAQIAWDAAATNIKAMQAAAQQSGIPVVLHGQQKITSNPWGAARDAAYTVYDEVVAEQDRPVTIKNDGGDKPAIDRIKKRRGNG